MKNNKNIFDNVEFNGIDDDDVEFDGIDDDDVKFDDDNV